MKGFTLLLISALLLIPQHVLAITPQDRRAINQDAVYYGGATSTQRLCGTVATDHYPILLPEISDEGLLVTAVDEYIVNRSPSSPFVGMGKYYVEGGIRAGINPVFMVALAVKESSLGTDQNTTALVVHNAFGRTASASQPSYQPGSRAWYAWDSWGEGLYSKNFPASGRVGDPDDMFQYIARRFNGNLESGLESFLEGGNGVSGYAPSSDGNNVPLYIETVTTVTNDIVELAGSAIDITRINPGGDSCASLDDVVTTALLYAWPDYVARRSERKREYQEAATRTLREDGWIGGCGGNDCGGFVTIVMRDSGFDPGYNLGPGYNCNTTCQLAYLKENWREIGKGSTISTADLEPGDVAIWAARPGDSAGHTFIYVGDQPGFDTPVASASWSSTSCTLSRAPSAGRESLTDARATWFRNDQ